MKIQESLFLAAQAGDADAIERLLTQLRPDIRRYASYHCERSSSVEDVVQEAMLILYRKVGTLHSLYALGGWLLKVVMRLCMLPTLMFIRGVVDLRNVENATHFASMPVDDLRIDLVRALESLSSTHREIILLRDLTDMSIGEIAQHLGITRESVKGRLHRARMLLKEYLLPNQ